MGWRRAIRQTIRPSLNPDLFFDCGFRSLGPDQHRLPIEQGRKSGEKEQGEREGERAGRKNREKEQGESGGEQGERIERPYFESGRQPQDGSVPARQRVPRYSCPIRLLSYSSRTRCVSNERARSVDPPVEKRRDLRHVVGTRPGRRILNVIVTRHMLCRDCNCVGRVFGQQEGCGQAGDARAAGSQSGSFDLGSHLPNDNDALLTHCCCSSRDHGTIG